MSGDFAIDYTPSRDPQTFKLNPWEVPVEANLFTFLLSWLIGYALLLGCSLVARNAFKRLVRARARSQFDLIASITLAYLRVGQRSGNVPR